MTIQDQSIPHCRFLGGECNCKLVSECCMQSCKHHGFVDEFEMKDDEYNKDIKEAMWWGGLYGALYSTIFWAGIAAITWYMTLPR